MQQKQNVDYHNHTRFSPDGHDSMNAMCKQAATIGLNSIAFTEHVEWRPGRTMMPPLVEYFEEIKECRQRFGRLGLTVLSGVELGNPQDHKDAVEALLGKYNFDVVIASLHWLTEKTFRWKPASGDAIHLTFMQITSLL